MANLEQRIVELSRTKIMLLIVGALGFVAAGLWLFLLDDAFIQSMGGPFRNPVLVHRAGLVAMVFFGVCALVGIRKMFDSKPGLVFSKEGLLDHASGVSAGLVPWNEIVGVDVLKVQRTRFLVVKVVNPRKYVERGGKLKRLIHQANLNQFGSPIQISATTLKINFDELVKLFNAYLANYGSRS